jgi:DNA helicase-2/ATP-dependent DNA helicase PcrA
MAGMEEGLFPHARSGDLGEELAEERRLCYVGMTRAMKKLYLSHARRRRVYGTYQFNPPSRFLAEIPAELLNDFTPTVALAEESKPEHNLASLMDLVAGAGAVVPADNPAAVSSSKVPVRETSTSDDSGLRLGNKVRHVKFGIGTVRRLEGSGDKQKVTVYFNSVGSKKLLMKFAGLMPV